MKISDFLKKHNLTEDSEIADNSKLVTEPTELTEPTEPTEPEKPKEDPLASGVKELTQAVKDLQDANKELAVLGRQEPHETFEDALFSVVGLKKEDYA